MAENTVKKKSKPGYQPKPLLCEKCQITFAKRSNIVKHIRRFHPDQELKLQTNQICPLCKGRFNKLTDLHTHLQTVHDINLKFEEKAFYVDEDFFQWKGAIEKETMSQFVVKSNTFKEKTGIKHTYYGCNRSGVCKPRINRTRRFKKSGSIKCNFTCPAMIHTKKETVDDISEIKVTFQSVHLGHGIELDKLRLPKADRNRIASCIDSGVPFDQVFQQIRESSSPFLNRLTKRGLHNICRGIKYAKKFSLQPDDILKINSFVENLKGCTDNPILLYKGVGEVMPNFSVIGEDEFLLGVMTKAQQKLLDDYGNFIVLVDNTPVPNQFGLQLMTLMVQDENQELLPVATLFSSRNSAVDLIPFFAEIKSRLPDLKAKIFVTHDADYIYDVWQTVFRDDAEHLLCSDYVFKEWCLQINNKVEGIKMKRIMKLKLKKVLSELDISTYLMLCHEFISLYEEAAQDFISYFSTIYKDRAEKWAHCYRRRLGIYTEIKTDHFHQLLKHNRYDTNNLEQYIARVMNAIAKKLMLHMHLLGDCSLSTKIAFIKERHEISLKMDKNYNVIEAPSKYVVIKEAETSSIKYDVEKFNTDCNCQIRCNCCNVCIHSTSCTCMDYCIRLLICKHIHYVCRKYSEAAKATSNLESIIAQESILGSEVVIANDSDSDGIRPDYFDEIIPEDNEFVDNLTYNGEKALTRGLKKSSPRKRQNKKIKLTNQKERLFKAIQKLQSKVQTCDSAENLQTVENTINDLIVYLDPSELLVNNETDQEPITIQIIYQ